VGLAVVTNGEFTAYMCDSAAMRPSSQITLANLFVIVFLSLYFNALTEFSGVEWILLKWPNCSHFEFPGQHNAYDFYSINIMDMVCMDDMHYEGATWRILMKINNNNFRLLFVSAEVCGLLLLSSGLFSTRR